MTTTGGAVSEASPYATGDIDIPRHQRMRQPVDVLDKQIPPPSRGWNAWRACAVFRRAGVVWVRLVALTVAGSVVLSACTSGPDHLRPTPRLKALTSYTSAMAPPPPYADTPLWTQAIRKNYGATPPPAAIAELSSIRLVGDALMTIGSVPGNRGTDRLVVSDARTGRVRWSATRGDRVGNDGTTYDFLQSAEVTGDLAGDWTIVVTSVRQIDATHVEDGVIGLSGRDGHLLWRIPVQRAPYCHCPWTRIDVSLLGPATATIVTVDIATITPTSTQHTRSVAYDTATGRVIWTATGLQLKAIEGGLLLAERLHLPANDPYGPLPGTLVALDLNTGAMKWDLAGRYPQGSLTYAGGDTLVVKRGSNSTVLVDTATGRELGTAPVTLTRCGRTPALFACLNGGGTTTYGSVDRAFAIQRDGDTATVTTVPHSQRCWQARVWRDLLYCTDTGRPQHATAINGLGQVAATSLPGWLETANDSFAVFSTGSVVHDDTAFAVYAVT